MVSIISFNQAVDFLLRSKISVLVEEFLEFVSTDESVLVLVQSLEAFVLVEERSSVQLLSDAFGVGEVANDSLEGLLQKIDGFIVEDLVQRNTFSIGRNSVVQDFSVAGILGGQDFAEGSESEDTFVVSVVFLQQEGDLVISWEDSELIEGVLDFSSSDKGLSFNVKELEGVQKVEVSSDGKVNLDVFQVLIEVDLLVEGVGEVFFFITLHWGDYFTGDGSGGGSLNRASVWASNITGNGGGSGGPGGASSSGDADSGGVEFIFEVSSGD